MTRHVDLRFLEEDPGVPRRYFSARWSGFWHIPADGEIDLYASVDDSVDVKLDGTVVAQRNADVGLDTEVRTVYLTAGPHPIEIEYEQRGGAYGLRLAWAPAGEAPRPFDTAALLPYRPDARQMALSEWSVSSRRLAGAMTYWAPFALAGMLLCFRTSAALVGAIILAAAGIRLHFAISTPYVWDEFRDWIIIADSISLDPATGYLPVHDFRHPSLPAYFIRAGRFVLGETALGYRLGGVIAGVATIVIVYLLARRWFGTPAAIVAAALLAFNDYHVGVSAFATEKPYYLFFAIAAAYFACEFHRTSKLSSACFCSGALGLGLLCKYLITLLIPVFGFAILLTGTWRKLQPRHVFVPAVILLVITAPDLQWNLSHGNTTGSRSANVSDHLRRMGGLGFSPHPMLFYLLDLSHSQADREAAGGRSGSASSRFGLGIVDPAPEYPAMNALAGVGLLGGMGWIAVSYLRRRRTAGRHAHATPQLSFVLHVLHLWFWVVFLFFTAIRPGVSKDLVPVVWFWVDSTLLPAVLLVGRSVSGLQGWRRYSAALLFGGGMLYGLVRML